MKYMFKSEFGGYQLSEEGYELVKAAGSCKACPFAGECEEKELCYSCPVWESKQGADL